MNAFSFKVKYNEDLALTGDYFISYKISFSLYPASKYKNAPVLTQTVPFTITVSDACKTTTLAFFDSVPYISKTYYLNDPLLELYKPPETFIKKI